MERANLSPRFISDFEHIIHPSTRLVGKDGYISYRGLGCFASKCIHPDLTCSHCLISFSTLSPFK